MLVLLLIAGFSIRLVGIDNSRISFHPTRQYLGLRVARWEYLHHQDNVAPEVRQAAKANARNSPTLEPRLLETVVAAGYRLLGSERLWLAGVLSSLLWILGGASLFLLARRLASELAAWMAVFIHLFLPFGIVGSRTFQPDPMMVAAVLAYLLALLLHVDRPTRSRWLWVAGVGALAIVVKPVAVFFVVGAFVAMTPVRGQKALLSRTSMLFVAGLLLPGIAYYGYQIGSGGAVAGSVDVSFVPHLYTEQAYWQEWWRFADDVASWPLLFVAIGSVSLARRREARFLMTGLVASYVIYGLVFNHHIHTHDYYSLILVPLVGLGAGIAVDAAAVQARSMELFPMVRVVAAGSALVLGVALVGDDVTRVRRQPTPTPRDLERRYEAIGTAVGHSTRAVMLTPDYGYSLSFHGNLAGTAWPTRHDYAAAVLRGERVLSPEEVMASVAPEPEWFVVMNLDELDHQPGLKELLARVGTVAAEGEDYRVYDLRRTG